MEPGRCQPTVLPPGPTRRKAVNVTGTHVAERSRSPRSPMHTGTSHAAGACPTVLRCETAAQPEGLRVSGSVMVPSGA